MRLWFLNVLIDAIKTSIQIAKPRGSYLEERCQKDVSVRGTTRGCLCCFLSLAQASEAGLTPAAGGSSPARGRDRVLCRERWQKGAAGGAGQARRCDRGCGEPQVGVCFCGFCSVRKTVTVAFSVCIRELIRMANSPLKLLMSADLKAVKFSLFC